MYQRFLLAGVFAAILACGRTHDSNRFDPKPDPRVAAPSSMSQSFLVEQTGATSGDKARLAISIDSLDKEFLLQGSVIPQIQIPQFSGLKSRVVAFKERGDRLYMLEATGGHKVTDDLPQNLLLASFPIVVKTPTHIFFDFNAGMSKIFVASEWRGSDFEGVEYQNSWQAAAIEESYLEEARIVADNYLVIRQVALVEESVGVRTPNEVKYYLTPYQPDSSFVPTPGTNMDRVGFFEVAPQLQKAGPALIYATKFHPNKPIVYAVSANTPDLYKQVFKEGITYWNKAFGKEVVSAVDAPEGVTAPDFEHNVVQWVNWDDAGFAYADAQADPRTGEILHAQVFMTSVFAIGGRDSARKLLRILKDSNNPGLKSYSLEGFHKGRLCDLELAEAIETSLESLLASNPSDEIIVKASQDYVRNVIAHEVGHTLGLRHNFAGSLAMTATPAEHHAAVNQYFKTGTVQENFATTSSVMEYDVFEDAAITGHNLLNAPQAMDYDAKAIQTLYLGTKFPNEAMPLFCTDSHEPLYADCKTFDVGSSPSEFLKVRHERGVERLANNIIEGYIAQKVTLGLADEALAESLDMLPLDYDARVQLLNKLAKGQKVLSVRRKFNKVSPVDEAEVVEQEQAYIRAEFEKIGGVENAFSLITKESLGDVVGKFSTLIKSEAYRSGLGPNEKPYEFSDREIELMIARVTKLADVANPFLAGAQLATYSMIADVTHDPVLSDGLANAMKELAKAVLYVASSTEAIEVTKADGTTVVLTLPVYAYGYDVRTMAAGIFSGRSTDLSWALYAKAELAKELRAHIDAVLAPAGVTIDTADPKTVPRKLASWILQNKTLLQMVEM
jgi:hypothetical protein